MYCFVDPACDAGSQMQSIVKYALIDCFRSILQCLRLLWRERRFFAEEHAAHAMTAVLRALAHFAGSGSNAAVDACLHFLCDLLTGYLSLFH